VIGARAAAAFAVALVAAAGLGAALYLRGTAPGAGDPGASSAARDASAPSGGEPEAYSATVRRRTGGGEAVETRVARRGDLSRHEWVEDGRRFASIDRPDRGVVLVVDLDRNVYVERPAAAAPEGTALTGDEVEALLAGTGAPSVARERAGEETVDGHPCVVYRTRIAGAAGTSIATVWEAQDLGGLAVRSETVDPDGTKATTELVDVRLDADPSLFEPPAGARRVDGL
jgi:outer membrane lipoprotein-sorting protein